MTNTLFTIFLVFNIILIIESIDENNDQNINKTTKVGEDLYQYALCDLRSSKANDTRNGTVEARQNLCKIECYTKLNNPGVCQYHTLNPCKTLDPSIEPEFCTSNANQKSNFKSICCPFKQEPHLPNPNNVGNDVSANKFDCGRRPTVQAIVGGIDAQPNTWPWVVSIYERQNPRSKPRFICGGSIIDNKYILSAAHCFVRTTSSSVRANRFVVKIGAHRLSDPNIRFREISEIKVHKKYNSIQHYNDIALIRVRQKIEFNPTVGPICLPLGRQFENRDFVGWRTKLVGWGATSFGGVVSDTMREVDVNVIDNSDCNRNYSLISGHDSGFPAGINEQLLCAGVANGGKDSCQGDSGGPLALDVNGQWYGLGIVSFGYKCAEPGYPGIYTRIQQFMNWIELNTQ